MSENEWTKILGWLGYRVYRSEINEEAKTVHLWVQRKRGNRKLECCGCGRRVNEIAETYEREVRDLPWSEYRTTVVMELYRVRCPDCGIKAEKVPQLPNKAPFRKRFEEAVGLACESAAGRRVAQQFGLPGSTVRAIDLRYLRRWAESRKRPVLRQMGVDLGKKQKFLTVVSKSGNGGTAVVRAGTEEGKDEFFEMLLDRLNPTISDLTQAIEQEVEKCPEARRLRTHPGVGALTALAFVLILRFFANYPAESQIDGLPVSTWCGRNVTS
jgi:hypothetical protein